VRGRRIRRKANRGMSEAEKPIQQESLLTIQARLAYELNQLNLSVCLHICTDEAEDSFHGTAEVTLSALLHSDSINIYFHVGICSRSYIMMEGHENIPCVHETDRRRPMQISKTRPPLNICRPRDQDTNHQDKRNPSHARKPSKGAS
jgi:hypothetical protein